MQKVSNDPQKRRIPSLLGFMAGFLLGLFLYACFFHPPASLYLPLSATLKRAGYELTGSSPLQYEKKYPPITLTISPSQGQLQKNQYLFEEEKGFISFFGVRYVSRTLLETALGLQIKSHLWGPSFHKPATDPFALSKHLSAPYIFHALGGCIRPQGEENEPTLLTHTNAKEALHSSYEAGCRLFEVDLIPTSDNHQVAVHNWKKEYGTVLSYQELREQGTPWGLTPLSVEELMQEMMMSPDLFLVLDMKGNSTPEKKLRSYRSLYDAAFQYAGASILDRIYPQIYEEEDYELVKSIYPWKGLIYSLYREPDKPLEDILRFLDGKDDILSITIPRARCKAEFIAGLHSSGRTVLTYTINDTEELYTWLNLGLDGFYTDVMSSEAYASLYGEGGRELFRYGKE